MNPVKFEFTSKIDGFFDWYMVHHAGDGSDCIVNLHGHGSCGDQFFTREDLESWRDEIKHQNLSVFAPNLRGNAWMCPAAAEDLALILRENREKYGWKRLFFIGGSMGATGSLIFAVRHPELVDGLGLLGAVVDIEDYREYCLNQHTYPIHRQIADAITEHYTNPEDFKTHSVRNQISKLTMPLRFYHGVDDPVMPVSGLHELQELLRDHPDAVFKVVPGTHDGPLPFFTEVLRSLL